MNHPAYLIHWLERAGEVCLPAEVAGCECTSLMVAFEPPSAVPGIHKMPVRVAINMDSVYVPRLWRSVQVLAVYFRYDGYTGGDQLTTALCLQ